MQYEKCVTVCIHRFSRGMCPNVPPVPLGQPQQRHSCDVGRRQRRFYILSGAVLGVWSAIETALSRVAPNIRLQIVRTRLVDGRRIVGCLVPPQAVEQFCEALQSEASLQDEDLVDYDNIVA